MSWQQYRRKPVSVQAYQTTGVQDLQTKTGILRAQAGDFVIRSPTGSVYPCDARTFRAYYEPDDTPYVEAIRLTSRTVPRGELEEAHALLFTLTGIDDFVEAITALWSRIPAPEPPDQC